MNTTITQDYRPPFWLKGGHLSTIYPAVFRIASLQAPYERERIDTPDEDFLDLDWLRSGNRELAILSHGLEGCSTKAYVTGMARALRKQGFDVLAWNYRGCSEQMNLRERMYHSGATDDLGWVINHASANYDRVHLIGFSLGGNLTLKYLGETQVHEKVSKSVAFSVPLDLHEGSLNILKGENYIYELRFLLYLKRKIKAKHRQYPKLIPIERWKEVKHLLDFDDVFTAPLHGFEGAVDYYKKCSSKHFIDTIKTPALVVNAENDPMLPGACLDSSLFANNGCVTFERPRYGGHCGFALFGNEGIYWSEQRAIDYLQS